MILISKIGTKWPADPYRGWRDGQIVDIRGDEYKPGKTELKHFGFIRVPVDYWALRKTTDWKAWNPDIEALKKYLCPVDSLGKYPWEFGAIQEESRLRCRDWFVDYKWLLDKGLITQKDFDNIYNKDIAQGIFNIDRDFTELLFHEDIKIRLTSPYSGVKGSIASGTYQIGTGAGADYATITAFEADIAAQLTGNLTGEHQNEETAISSSVTFDTDTNTYLLKLTAESGAEHNGGAYGNGARINFGTYQFISLDETNDGDLDDVEISKLAIDISGTNNKILIDDGSNSGQFVFNRMLIIGDSSINIVLSLYRDAKNVLVTNNIIYGATGKSGIGLEYSYGSNATLELYNNTVAKCGSGIHQGGAQIAGTHTVVVKNNLCQGNTNDYLDAGGGFGTTSKNISEDATSPDAAYQSKDLHTNTIFQNYAGSDYRLDSGGDSTNLAIADDGDDLSGTFTDDIQGQTRNTWYIGASEIVAAGGLSIPIAMHHYTKNIASGR